MNWNTLVIAFVLLFFGSQLASGFLELWEKERRKHAKSKTPRRTGEYYHHRKNR